VSTFPQYSFEDILNKTPDWLEWTIKRVMAIEKEKMDLISAIFGGGKSEKKEATDLEINKMGIKVIKKGRHYGGR